MMRYSVASYTDAKSPASLIAMQLVTSGYKVDITQSFKVLVIIEIPNYWHSVRMCLPACISPTRVLDDISSLALNEDDVPKQQQNHGMLTVQFLLRAQRMGAAEVAFSLAPMAHYTEIVSAALILKLAVTYNYISSSLTHVADLAGDGNNENILTSDLTRCACRGHIFCRYLRQMSFFFRLLGLLSCIYKLLFCITKLNAPYQENVDSDTNFFVLMRWHPPKSHILGHQISSFVFNVSLACQFQASKWSFGNCTW